MTIAATSRVTGFVGDGLTAAFPFTFAVLDPADLFAETLVVATGVIDRLAAEFDYSVSLNADQNTSPGGSITLLSSASGPLIPVPLPVGSTLTITTARPMVQTVDLTSGGAFYPDVINTALDALTILVQQLADRVALCIQVPLVDGAPLLTLGTAVVRRNLLLGFDGAGNVALSSGGSGGGGGGGGGVTLSSQVAVGDVNDDNMLFTFTAPATPTPIPLVFAAGVFQTPTEDYSNATLVGGTTWQFVFVKAPAVGPITVVLFG